MLFPFTGEANPMLQKLKIIIYIIHVQHPVTRTQIRRCRCPSDPPPPSWPGHQIGARPGDLKKKHGFCWTWEISCLLDMDTWLVVRFEDLKLLRPIFQVLFFFVEGVRKCYQTGSLIQLDDTIFNILQKDISPGDSPFHKGFVGSSTTNITHHYSKHD